MQTVMNSLFILAEVFIKPLYPFRTFIVELIGEQEALTLSFFFLSEEQPKRTVPLLRENESLQNRLSVEIIINPLTNSWLPNVLPSQPQ